jgi:antitoxin VapB
VNDKELFSVRQALVQTWLREKGLDGVLLSRPDNFAMATGGRRNFIWTHADLGSNALYVPREGTACFVGDTIERPRILDEELGVLGCGSVDYVWFDSTPAQAAAARFPGKNVSDDGSLGANVHGDLAVLRALLTEEELGKYRVLGTLAAEAMTATLDAVEEGMPEADITAVLMREGAARRCQVPVALVAADDRIARYRHPLPTVGPLVGTGLDEVRVRGYVMVVGCFLREGLVVSLTRFKRVGDIPPGIEDAYDRICAVDALVQEATVPGRTLGEVFDVLRDAYVRMGFPQNEWHNHHQGGATGYAGRTCKAVPGCPFPVLDTFWPAKLKEHFGLDVPFGSAFAWNPSGVGVKSEDTFILLPDGTREIVSETSSLPQVHLDERIGRPVEAVKSGMAG